MAAEAVHFSALADASVDPRVPAFVRSLLRRQRSLARLGALLVDLPYFGGFTREMARYALRLPPTPAPWGDRFHRRAPVRLAAEILAEAARRGSEPLAALGLGYLTHVAIDSTLHPPVNRLVDLRVAPLGRLKDDAAAQHREIEKYQSVLFHEARHGFDFMGSPRLLRHLHVRFAALGDGPIAGGLAAAMDRVLGGAPRMPLWWRWARGYLGYAVTLSSPIGATLVPARVKPWARATFFQRPDLDYLGCYGEALTATSDLLARAAPLVARRPLPAPVVDEFLGAVPERSLDYPERPFVAE